MNTRRSPLIRFASSLGFAIILLSLIAGYIVIGTLLIQHAADAVYLERYPTFGPLILALGLNKAYSSPLFLFLMVLFSINLTLCTITSLKGQLIQLKQDYYPSFTQQAYTIDGIDEAAFVAFAKRRGYRLEEAGDNKRAAKYRFGVLGAAITHLGIIILCLGGAIGNMSASEEMVNLLPGGQSRFEEEGFTITLDDFYLSFDDNGAIKQYISEVVITDDGSEPTAHALWVNKPLRHKGVGFYQANWGWVNNLVIIDTESGEKRVEGMIRSGKSYFDQQSHLTVYLYGYYPEMGVGHNQEPVKKSERQIDPYYAVILYKYGQNIGSYIISPGEHIHHENLAITFTHSVAYTGLLVRRDHSYPIVLTAFIIMLIGLVVSFYAYPRFLSYADGVVTTKSRRNGWIFHQSIKSAFARKR